MKLNEMRELFFNNEVARTKIFELIYKTITNEFGNYEERGQFEHCIDGFYNQLTNIKIGLDFNPQGRWDKVVFHFLGKDDINYVTSGRIELIDKKSIQFNPDVMIVDSRTHKRFKNGKVMDQIKFMLNTTLPDILRKYYKFTYKLKYEKFSRKEYGFLFSDVEYKDKTISHFTVSISK